MEFGKIYQSKRGSKTRNIMCTHLRIIIMLSALGEYEYKRNEKILENAFLYVIIKILEII